jgi:hypothetical protein
MANAVYRRIFGDVFVMTSAEKSIRRDVFALYSGEIRQMFCCRGYTVLLQSSSFVNLRLRVLRYRRTLGRRFTNDEE